MALDPLDFRKALGQFATGVTVVTTAHGGAAQGMTVNSFSSVSLEPPLVLFCADKRARTHAAVAASGVFAVNVLREEQRALSDLFAGKGTDEERRAALAPPATTAAATGAPILAGSLAWMDCRVAQAIDAGDHVVYVGEVLAAHRGEAASPLLYFRGTYQSLHEAWFWSDRYAAREHATPFDAMVDFVDRLQAATPFADLLLEFAAYAGVVPEASCLDVGCGAGALTRELAARSREVHGVDASAQMIERASRRAREFALERLAYHVARAEALPFDESRFDLVTATNLAYLVRDPVAVLRECFRVTKPGGHVALLNPSTRMTRPDMADYARAHGHGGFEASALLAWAGAAEAHRPYDEDRMATELAAAGFESVTQRRTLGGLALLSRARRPE